MKIFKECILGVKDTKENTVKDMAKT